MFQSGVAEMTREYILVSLVPGELTVRCNKVSTV